MKGCGVDPAKRGAAARASWTKLSPEQRAERIRRTTEARLASLRAKQLEQDELPDEPMEPRDRELVPMLQVACTRWLQRGARAGLVEALVVAIVLERHAGEVLRLVADQVARHEQDGRTLAHLAELADLLVERHELPGPTVVMEALMLAVGLDPDHLAVLATLPPVPGTDAWIA